MKNLIFVSLILLSVIATASPYVKPSESSGVVVFNRGAIGNSQGERVLPVSLFEIDGEEVLRRKAPVWLSPGIHTLRVKANGTNQILGTNRFNRTENIRGSNKQNTIKVNVENGMYYYIGYDIRNRNPNEWKAIVWKAGELR